MAAETELLDDAAARVERLRHEIEQANYQYHTLDAPTIPDAEYDSMMRELIVLEQSHPELQSPDSPSQRVGGQVSAGFHAHRHRVPMLSLGNAFSVHELDAWYQRVVNLLGSSPPLVAEPKIDGLAVSLTYEKGSLTIGSTRGNGAEGENVTANLRTLRDIPLRLAGSAPGLVEVRGEIYMSVAGFEALNQKRAEEGLSLFANPRNSAAGSLRQLDSTVTKGRPLHLFSYAIGALEDGLSPASQTELLAQLREWGLPVNDLIESLPDIQAVDDFCRRMSERRESLDYEIDGVVVKVDDLAAQTELGFVGREPRWAIAFKFAPMQATTRLNEIRVNVGRTGSLNPYAVLEPVKVGGVVVSQATLHNEQDINRKDIREGDRVIIHRAGDVIPQVVKPIVEDRTGSEVPYHLPVNCPSCDTPVVRHEDEAMAFCPNPDCPARRYEQLFHFVSQGAMDMRGLGSRVVATLADRGLIRDAADIYSLTTEDFLTLPNIKEKSAANYMAAIERSKTRSLINVLFALGIRFVGFQTAELLVAAFGSMDAISMAGLEELETVPGIGERLAASITEWFADPVNQDLVDRLAGAGLRMEADSSVPSDGPLSGLNFLLTGTLEHYTRPQAEQALRERGAKIAPGVSKTVNYLVAGEKAGSKLAKAQKLGVEVRNEAWLTELLESGKL